jgi:hypothetical protein
VYGQIALSFALIAAGGLLCDYFVQFSVVPVSLMNDQREGISLVTQYSHCGVFIVLEEVDECCVVVGMGSSSRRKGQSPCEPGPPIPGCSRTRAARVPGRAPSAR